MDTLKEYYAKDTRKHWVSPLPENHTRLKCMARYVQCRYKPDDRIVCVGGGTDALQARALKDAGFTNVENTDVAKSDLVDWLWDIQEPAPPELGEPRLLIASEVLEHTFHTEEAFRHIADGPWSLLITVPNDDPDVFGPAAYAYGTSLHEHIRHFTFPAMLRMFGKYGRGFGLETMGLSPEESVEDVTALSILHKVLASYEAELGKPRPELWEAAYVLGNMYPLRLRGLLLHHRRI